ncbi:uncharacterized protein PFLUO_LOCUS197 [Penicillium psychrofluorescens]|uniref:uncharacterized protein n=1 Tax=Penicillium psychrofluorescens TaxID=3158075 RepID=UPI003CCD4A7F
MSFQQDDTFINAAEKTQDNRFLLPGFHRPLDFYPMEKNIYGIECRSMFPTALDDRDIQRGDADLPAQTLREIAMVHVMEEITDIPQWWTKIHDPGVTEEWKSMAMNSGRDVTLNMANWIIEELKFKALIQETTETVALYNGDATKSDVNVSKDLLEELKTVVKVLEYADPRLHFFTPCSKDKQRDYLSMALFPLVYGKSRILGDRLIGLDDALDNIGKGEPIPIPKETGITREDLAWRVLARADIQVRPYSRFSQILPTDWQLGDDNKWHIETYINNLHPVKHRNIYKVIERIFNCIIPQWNATLTPLKDQLHSRARIEYTKAEYYPIPKDVADSAPQIQPREANSEFEERLEKWRMEHVRAIQPDAGEFIPWAVPPWLMSKLPEDLPSPVRIEEGVDLNKDYKQRGLQVVTRLLSVDLDPEDRYYETDWHVELQMNEHICAAAFYIYDTENMEDPNMEFRNMVETATLSEVEHEPGDFTWLKQVFGLENGEPAIQSPGAIRCKVGRTVIYPTTVQHRLTGFELKDKSKPGYSRALVFLLVDPNIRIISTANVPPQRYDWCHPVPATENPEELSKAMQKLALDNIDRKGDLPMSLAEALEIRKEVMNEGYEFTRYQHVAFESNLLML